MAKIFMYSVYDHKIENRSDMVAVNTHVFVGS